MPTREPERIVVDLNVDPAADLTSPVLLTDSIIYAKGWKTLYALNAATLEVVPFACSPIGYVETRAAFELSPDGKRIVFGSGDGLVMWKIELGNASATRVTDAELQAWPGGWSPDGSELVFTAIVEETDAFEVFAMNADGSDVRQLTDVGGISAARGWSTLEDRILFASDRDGGWDVYTMDRLGSDVVRLTGDDPDSVSSVADQSRFDEYPRFSPDEDSVAFIRSDTAGSSDLYVMRADGTELQRLVESSDMVGKLLWSPDGTQIAFQRYVRDDESWEMYAVDVGSGEVRQILHQTAYDPGVPVAWVSSLSSTVTSMPVIPISWPVPPPDRAQFESVYACDITALIDERYPPKLDIDDLAGAYDPACACDWAVLSAAYADRMSCGGDFTPDEARMAFVQAIARNPAFVFVAPLCDGYFDSGVYVEPPPLSRQDIAAVRISYQWSGLGTDVLYLVQIDQGNTDPVVTITPEGLASGANIDRTLVQALGEAALGDLFPVTPRFQLEPCTDNYPMWTVSLTFVNGEKLHLSSGGSNYLGVGGPWEVAIGEENYVQFSSAFASAVVAVTDALGLPLGEPEAMFCGGADPLAAAFPESVE